MQRKQCKKSSVSKTQEVLLLTRESLTHVYKGGAVKYSL